MKTWTLALLALVSIGLSAQTADGLDAVALLAKLDHNEAGTSSHVVGAITVEDRLGKKVSGFESWTQGADQSLVVFTSGEEKGQKILRKGPTLYVAYPEADKPVKLQGAALKDSVAGSDFSYEDMAGDKGFAARYDPKLVGEEAVAGDQCAILELRAKKSGLAYPLVKVWVSLSDFSGRKMEKYSQNGRLLKTQEVLEVLKASGRTIPAKTRMADALKTRSQTLFEITKAELDVAIAPKTFSLEELTW